MKTLIKKFVLKILKIIERKYADTPSVGDINFGDFRRLSPFCKDFGYTRGGPIDRYYIEKFLKYYQNDIRNKVLEIKFNEYTKRFGNSKVTHSDILDINPNNHDATIIADLTKADNIPSNTYDCVILTQVLQFIYDFKAAIRTIHRILKPAGVLLITVPGISKIDSTEYVSWVWAFSDVSLKNILSEFFPSESIVIEKYGNVLTASSFLYGLGIKELREEEYEYMDHDYSIVITGRAVKSL